MTYDTTIERVVQVVEATGVVVMVLGGLVALCAAVPAAVDPTTRPGAYQQLRRSLGRVILLGLELLIIADIILTVTVEQTLESAATLGVIVLVRTFLSFSLEVELEGVLPWRKRESRPTTDGEPIVDID